MPAQTRSLASDDPSPPLEAEDQTPEVGFTKQEQTELPKQENEMEDEDGSSDCENEEFVFVKLADIRKEVQCPICLGIIRKTRTVMECLHRFCRECIDKSMRLGNNECPACRTHCASRRSLRDDPNYDTLIAALYPDIDKYEEEELAFHEEEQNRNKKIQASIAETFRRQSEALGKKKPTTRSFSRRSQHRRSSRGRNSNRDTSLAVSEDEEEDGNGNENKDSSSAEEPSPERRPKRRKRWTTPQHSPARIFANAENDDDAEPKRDNRGVSPLIAGNGEKFVWGRGGTRSQMRHGNSSGANGRSVKVGSCSRYQSQVGQGWDVNPRSHQEESQNSGSVAALPGNDPPMCRRATKLVEHFLNLDENDNEFEVHLTLLPIDASVPKLQSPYICCRPTSSIEHLCQFIALQISVKAEDVELFAKKVQGQSLVGFQFDPLKGLQILGEKESVAGLRNYFTNTKGDLELVYRLMT